MGPVTLYGDLSDYDEKLRDVLIELFDEDRVVGRISLIWDIRHCQGPPEFIGRATTTPNIHLVGSQYEKPTLSWSPVYKGAERGGEILAAAELIQVVH